MAERHQIMNDREFWSRLEYDTCRWLENADDRNLRHFWIDGFSPDTVINTQRGLQVGGVAWVGECKGTKQHAYRFVASVPQKLLHRHRQSFVIEKLSFDTGHQFLEVVIGERKRLGQSEVKPFQAQD